MSNDLPPPIPPDATRSLDALVTRLLLPDQWVRLGVSRRDLPLSFEKAMDILDRQRIVIDEAPIIGVIEQLAPWQERFPAYYALAGALRLLAVNSGGRAAEVIARFRLAMSDVVRLAVAQAEGLLIGVDDPHGFCCTLAEEKPFDALTKPQQFMLNIRHVIDHVNNGGFEFYFAHAWKPIWWIAVEGFRAIGAPTDASIVEEAIALFDADNLSEEEDVLDAQIDRVVQQHEDGLLDEIDCRFYDDVHDREVRLSRYANANPDHFRR